MSFAGIYNKPIDINRESWERSLSYGGIRKNLAAADEDDDDDDNYLFTFGNYYYI